MNLFLKNSQKFTKTAYNWSLWCKTSPQNKKENSDTLAASTLINAFA
jgi:hypothetical protein